MSNFPDYIIQGISVLEQVRDQCCQDVEAAARLIADCFQRGNKLLICGNGGSAADAQHIAGELVPLGYPAIALTTDTSVITAWANDKSYDAVFAKQVSSLGKPGDVLLGISTSGRSKNVYEAALAARAGNMTVIAATGKRGLVGDVAQIVVRAGSTETTHIQEAHEMIYHWLCAEVDRLVKG